MDTKVWSAARPTPSPSAASELPADWRDNWAAWGPPGYVVIGEDDFTTDDVKGAIWFSEDGLAWQRVAHDNETFGIPDTEDWFSMFAVTYGDDGYVAVGVIDGPSGHTGAIWHSVDGLAWTLIEGQPDLHGGGGVFIEDVTGVDGGYLAVGSQRTAIGVAEDGQPLASEAAAMCFSPNGTQWTRLPDDGVFAPNGEQVTLRNVGADGLRIVDYREEPADAPPPEDPDAVEWVGRIWYGSLS